MTGDRHDDHWQPNSNKRSVNAFIVFADGETRLSNGAMEDHARQIQPGAGYQGLCRTSLRWTLAPDVMSKPG